MIILFGKLLVISLLKINTSTRITFRSGLEPNDMQIIYHFLINIFLPPHIKAELAGGPLNKLQKSPFNPLCHGRFITGLSGSNTKLDDIPKVHICDNSNDTCYYIIVYRALSASVCLFIEG